MKYRELGKTGLMVSEVGLGGEWLEKQSTEAVKAIIDCCGEQGINIIDCWMSEPNVRSNIGLAIEGKRDKWILQGQIGSTWRNGQYERTRELEPVKEAFEDLLTCFRTDYIDLGLIHYVDDKAEFEKVTHGEFWDYLCGLKREGKIRHIGISTHNPEVGLLAARHGDFEMMLFSVNPAFDMLPATENIDDYFASEYGDGHTGIDPIREELYRVCEQNGVGITVMKCYAGGRLFNKDASPFGVALTPAQCIHYALTRPAVASVLIGCTTTEHVHAAAAYETATEQEKDYATVLSGAPRNSYRGQCTYCGHCSPCSSRIDIAMVNKLSDLAAMQSEVPDTVRGHYDALETHAGDCIACGACEERCPFGVKIVERMAKTAELFGK